ncbi:MAG TPA: hypothetical protein VN205_10355, partial [Thermomonas sp.]|nr:hypothetical protein [Thermomonas sp.]
MPSRHPVRTAATLLTTTGAASASVIAARMLAFADPTAAVSPWHQSEARRMTSEKLGAAGEGMLSAGAELALLPYRMLQLASRPSAWTPAGWVDAWMHGAGLWVGV